MEIRVKQHSIPGIGMRIIKSATAVAICFLVDRFRGGRGIVFYSQLAALWCMQGYRSNTKQNAIQRTIGTVIGAVYGLLYLLFYLFFLKKYANVAWIEKGIISLMIVVVLYTTVLIKKTQASYFSCVVFLSVVVNHIADGNPYLFVWNRFLDTMIGIVIGIAINNFKLPIHRDNETLFISGLDDTLLNSNEALSNYSKVELNRMIDDGMNFTISTIRTPASLIEPLREIRLKLPVIAMDGAVLYDIQTNEYLRVYVISAKTSQRLMGLIEKAGLCWYANVIIDDMLVIYYGDMEDEVNLEMVKKLRTSPFRNYVKRPLPKQEEVTYFMLLNRTEVIQKFYQTLEAEGMLKELKVINYPSKDYEGYSYLKIYNQNATKENMIMYLKEMTGLRNVVTFGTIPEKYDVLIQADNANEVVRETKKMYEKLFF